MSRRWAKPGLIHRQVFFLIKTAGSKSSRETGTRAAVHVGSSSSTRRQMDEAARSALTHSGEYAPWHLQNLCNNWAYSRMTYFSLHFYFLVTYSPIRCHFPGMQTIRRNKALKPLLPETCFWRKNISLNPLQRFTSLFFARKKKISVLNHRVECTESV